MLDLFSALGRATVRFRFLIVIVWVAVTVVGVKSLPSLSDVAQDTTSGFLPANAPSIQAAALGAPFQNSSLATATLVVANAGGLTAADNAAVDRLETAMRAVPRVKGVVDLGISSDGEARTAAVAADVVAFSGGPEAKGVVTDIRGLFSQVDHSDGLEVHLSGQLATQIDSTAASTTSLGNTQRLTFLFIVVLLLLAFRAVLAPLVTLVPAVLVLALAGPVIAESTKIGVQVSSITQLLLVVLILGAGTDYGIFLVFRVREELRAGRTPHEAVIQAVTRVGESITFSGLTVIAALVSLVFADFGIYQSLGPALAIGIALMLLAGLTLLPALLAILGRAVFWPSRLTVVVTPSPGIWDRVAKITTRRPLMTLTAGVVLFAALACGLIGIETQGFGATTANTNGSDSAAGTALIAKHLPASTASRSAILLQFPESVWTDPTVIGKAQTEIASFGEFSGLVGPLNPNGVALTPGQLTGLHATLGSASGLPATPPTSAVSAQLYNAYRATAQLISPDGRTVQFSVEFANGDASSPAALDQVPPARADVAAAAIAVGATRSGFLGQAALAYDVSHVSSDDLARIIPIVAVLIAILLALVLRSLIAPLYLVASILLSYLAALGLTAIVFVRIGGQEGLSFILPFLLFVFLMALGSDYNILIMSRIREEARELPLREAVAKAIGRTGSTVTTAGVILGGTFAVLAIGSTSGNSQVQQIGFGVAAGILMDTFLVRSLLVPSVVVLLGRWNWWPSSPGASAHQAESTAAAIDRGAGAR